ncbi:MAG TPA: glycosyltransferase family 2 protein [Dinghuibacter sp.]|uniref:glycosyltransferase family 2 protein n=1 Tax=Dinghuibacter sp. TaxID=2024697 RepID=UPI002D0DC7D1|nr:glycosyltransferase family 2 protein [Dinghuibacter sp.]HTJ13243.1 glycosyltransferase family 2 protein [Dinghuibacter sp.]
MLHHKKIVVVLPAFNAARTLERTYREIPFDIVDDVILVDDASQDETLAIAHRLGIRHVVVHDRNKGYGGNQKTCYRRALELDADIVIMLHPDYQYTPKLIPAMASLIAQNIYPVVLGSRILGRGAIKGGMPRYKYFFNRVLTLLQNILMGQKLSEYHTGYRAFAGRVLAGIGLQNNSDDFVFDNELLAQICMQGYEIAEITCPTAYFPEASSIRLKASIRYGLGVLRVAAGYRLHKWGLRHSRLFHRPNEAYPAISTVPRPAAAPIWDGHR